MDRAEFEAYLQANVEQTYERCSSMRCPIAQFLATKYEWADVGDIAAYVPDASGRSHEIVLPEWAVQFIARFDDEGRHDAWTATGADALAVLATV